MLGGRVSFCVFTEERWLLSEIQGSGARPAYFDLTTPGQQLVPGNDDARDVALRLEHSIAGVVRGKLACR